MRARIAAVAAGTLAVVAGAFPADAGPPKPRAAEATAVRRAAAHATSRPARELEGRRARGARWDHAPLRRDRPAGTSAAVPTARTVSRPGARMPATVEEFDGITNVDGALPPDPTGEAGPDHYVEMVNVSFAVYDKAGAELKAPTAISALFVDLPGTTSLCETTDQGDPIVLYDQLADRWMLSQFAFDVDGGGNPVGPYHQCIAVSETGDPTGSYHLYDFEISATKLDDYPKFGVWHDAYYMSANQFDDVGYAGVGVVAFERDVMLTGGDAEMVYVDLAESFDPDLDFFGMLPSDLDGTTEPPAAAPNYFVEVEDAGIAPWFPSDRLMVFEFDVDWTAVPPTGTFTGPTLIDLETEGLAYDADLCGLSLTCIPTPGTPPQHLDALSDRLMMRAAYRNFESHEAIVLNHTVDVGSDHAAIRWYELRDPGSPAIHQAGTYSGDGGGDALHRWMGSIAMDDDGNVALGYSVSSDDVEPAIRYVGRLETDDLNTLPQGESTLHAGTGHQTSTSGRWGDYSHMSVDPDGCTFWYVNEYYSPTSVSSWRTRVGSFEYPACSEGDPDPGADFDGDGFADLAIGVPEEDVGAASGAGSVQVLYGSAAGATASDDQLWHQDLAGVGGSAESGDNFGTALAVGDFDGDGLDDLAIGVPGEDIGDDTDTGSLHVLYGSAGGLTDADEQTWHQDSAGIIGAGEDGDQWAFSLATGDFDGDAFDDLAVGAPGESVGSDSEAGAVSVLYGTASGLDDAGNQSWHQDSAFIEGGAEPGDQFGFSIASADFQEDGRDDLAIGCPGENFAGRSNPGAVHVIYGRASGLSAANDDVWSQDSSGIANVAESGDAFGFDVAAADFDGDGQDDLAIGAPGEGFSGAPEAGAVHALYGSASSALTSGGSEFWHQNVSGIEDSAEADDRYGYELTAGDFDGDGQADLAIGVPFEDTGGDDAGLVSVLYGTSSGGLSASGDDAWTQDSPGVDGATEEPDEFGFALASADYDGDGSWDLAIGAPGEAFSGLDGAGAVSVLFGSAGGVTGEGDQVWSQNTSGVGESAAAGDGFGFSLAS